ncbi:MAG: hypothetical protein HY658_00775 [Actinobacteria bacterium]|nr:hypothetical protein [Actinomycetota bacterium]
MALDREGIPDEVLRLAEDANSYQPLGPGEERIVEPNYILFLAPHPIPQATVVQRLRLNPASVAGTVARIRDLIRERGRPAATWEVGSSATPADLADRLLQMGMVPDQEPLAVGMVLTGPPAGEPPEDVEVRVVRTAEEHLAAIRIAETAFGLEELTGGGDLELASRELAETAAAGHAQQFLAHVDGEPVATGRATFTPHGVVLNGGSTLPGARGRGAYRALVHARWEEAVRRGTPALVTQAGRMSRPILARLGFREVCEIRILLDELARD